MYPAHARTAQSEGCRQPYRHNVIGPQRCLPVDRDGGRVVMRFTHSRAAFARILASGLVTTALLSGALAQSLRLHCVQQSRQICEQGEGCKVLRDASPNQWTFTLEKQSGKVLRCAGRECGSPFEVLVSWGAAGEILFLGACSK